MKPMQLPVLLLLAGLIAGSAASHAARPFVTDDARTVDPGGCQIESFAKQQLRSRASEFWFLPACNPLGNLEMTLGSINSNDTPDSSHTLIVQGKTLLRPLQTNGFGLAMSAGALETASPAPAARWSPYVNLIASLSLRDDALVLHANAGALNDRPASRSRATWGAGAEIPLTARLYGIAESYGQEGERPSQHAGLRYWIEPNRIQVDGSAGTQRGRTWLSMGIRLLF